MPHWQDLNLKILHFIGQLTPVRQSNLPSFDHWTSRRATNCTQTSPWGRKQVTNQHHEGILPNINLNNSINYIMPFAAERDEIAQPRKDIDVIMEGRQALLKRDGSLVLQCCWSHSKHETKPCFCLHPSNNSTNRYGTSQAGIQGHISIEMYTLPSQKNYPFQTLKMSSSSGFELQNTDNSH